MLPDRGKGLVKRGKNRSVLLMRVRPVSVDKAPSLAHASPGQCWQRSQSSTCYFLQEAFGFPASGVYIRVTSVSKLVQFRCKQKCRGMKRLINCIVENINKASHLPMRHRWTEDAMGDSWTRRTLHKDSSKLMACKHYLLIHPLTKRYPLWTRLD